MANAKDDLEHIFLHRDRTMLSIIFETLAYPLPQALKIRRLRRRVNFLVVLDYTYTYT